MEYVDYTKLGHCCFIDNPDCTKCHLYLDCMRKRAEEEREARIRAKYFATHKVEIPEELPF